MKCNFNPYMCHNTWLFCLLFNAGYTASYIGSVYLNKDSPVFGMIAGLIGSPLATIFWLLFFPSFAPPGNSWWSLTFSILPLYAGVILWKGWELRLVIGGSSPKKMQEIGKEEAEIEKQILEQGNKKKQQRSPAAV